MRLLVIGFLLLGAVLGAEQGIPIAPANVTLDGVLASLVRHGRMRQPGQEPRLAPPSDSSNQ